MPFLIKIYLKELKKVNQFNKNLQMIALISLNKQKKLMSRKIFLKILIKKQSRNLNKCQSSKIFSLALMTFQMFQATAIVEKGQ